jgi:uncharacterized protein YegP (UPF0339 family)
MITRIGSLFAGLLMVGFLAPVPAVAQAKEGLKFEIYQDAAKDYRWRLKDGDGKVLATAGQGYKAKESAKNGVKLIQTEADSKLKFEVYEDKGKEFRWRAKSPNGQTVASSGSAYKEKSAADKAIDVIKKGAAKAAVEEVK